MNFILLILAWLTLVGSYQSHKPLPLGVNYKGQHLPVTDSDLVFVSDLTYTDSSGELYYRQEIFDSVFTFIDRAQAYILIDMFLFNSFKGPSAWSMNELSLELSQRLVNKKLENPAIEIDFMTDPMNTVYGGIEHSELASMKAVGINTMVVDLTRLRDSNPLYSPVWRSFFQWFGNSSHSGILPNAFHKSSRGITARSYLAFLNLKANHRKVFVADQGERMVSVVTSANAHSGSADFSNVGVIAYGDVWRDIYRSERELAAFSGYRLGGNHLFESNPENQSGQTGNAIQLITEGQIRDRIHEQLESSVAGDSIKMAMFYISKRSIVKALLDASKRGVVIQMVLDPNKDGFGFHHNGTPNRPVAKELVEDSRGKIRIRWYRTQGEQFHSKLTYFKKRGGPHIAILGSANLTRKNLDNYNLEADLMLTLNPDSQVAQDINHYFDQIWFNKDAEYTTAYPVYGEVSSWKTGLYRFQEFTGMSTY